MIAKPHPESDSATASQPAPMRVLVVDPYRPSRDGLRASLRTAGCSVEAAGTGWDAVKRMTNERFDIALIDLDLPLAPPFAVSAWDLARIFRAFDPQVALILVTSERRPEVTTQAGRLPGVTLLEKPINPVELRPILRALCPEPGPRLSEEVSR